MLTEPAPEQRPAGRPIRFEIVTIFPELFEPFVRTSIVGRAVARDVASIGVHDLREWTSDRHRTVDDYPYGGGAGMVMRVEPFARSLETLKAQGPAHVVLFSARGEIFSQEIARELAALERVVLLCGHYKGVDERVAQLADRELSVGDYVLSGGEIPAMAVIDAVVRLEPGAVGDQQSVLEDSHWEGLLSAPEYTRPEVFEGMQVPPVLLTGDHAKIRRWRRDEAERLTKERRPDLYRCWLRSQKEDTQGARSKKCGPRAMEEP